jgi:hypothetical protein
MVQRIVIAWLILLSLDAKASQTLIKRCMFAPTSFTNVCDISATNLLGFDSVITDKTWPTISIGATTNGQADLGWSGWFQKGAISNGRWTNLTLNTYYQASMWFRLHAFSTDIGSDTPNADTSSQYSRIFNVGRAGDLNSMAFGVAGAGSLWFVNANGDTTNIASLKVNQDYYFAIAWRSRAGPVKDGGVFLGIGTLATNIYSFTNVACNNTLTWCEAGFGIGGSKWMSGRCTGVSLHTLTDFGSVGVPTDINPPSQARATYYINPSTGSDLNSGVYATNAWASAFQVQKLLRFGGARSGLVPWVYTVDDTTATPGSNPWAFNRGIMDGLIHPTGDRILLDTSGVVLRGTNCWTFMTNNVGVEIGSANLAPGEYRPWTLLSGTWTQYDAVNFPNIWKLANPRGQSNIVVWEDQKWLDNPTNTSGLVNLTTNLNSTPGSFWTDTTNVYVHPFASTNPNSDGKTYECSQWLYNNTTLSKYHTVELFDNGGYLHNLKLWGNVYRNQYTGTWDATYVVRLANNGPGVIGDTELRYGGKHVYGAVDGATNLYRFNYNCVFQQGPPWTDITGTSGSGNEVEFPTAGVGTRQAYFWNVNAATNSVIGSTTGGTLVRDGFFSHQSSGPYEAYSALHYFNCIGSISSADAMVTPGSLIISNCTSSLIASTPQITNALNIVVKRSYVDGPIYGGGGGTVTETINNRTDNLDQNLLMTGTWRFDGCTFDARSTTNTAGNLVMIKSDPSIAATISVSNSVILLPNNAADITLLRYKSTDTLNFNNNVWLPNAQAHVTSDTGTEKTWAQWQALPQDAASSTNNAAIDSRYRPYAKTPTWNVATDRGASIDYTGKLFQSRRTAGAYEYVTDNPMFLMFHR